MHEYEDMTLVDYNPMNSRSMKGGGACRCSFPEICYTAKITLNIALTIEGMSLYSMQLSNSQCFQTEKYDEKHEGQRGTSNEKSRENNP